MFVNRAAELQFLLDHFERPGASLLVLWGRRRVGKTTLLREFASRAGAHGHPLLYHVGVRTTETEALLRLSDTLAQGFGDALLRIQPLTSWEAVFAYLSSRSQPFGLLIDEFPYLVESAPALPTKLQAAWDASLQHGQVKLVLCGSSVAMMEQTLLDRGAPLHGRRTGQWKVEPFSPADVAALHAAQGVAPRLVPVLEAFAVLGGVPLYAGQHYPKRPLEETIKVSILTKGEPLYEEVPFLLRQELREPRVYQAILSALAGGATSFGELSSKTGLERANLTRYLAQLDTLGLLRREVPVTEPKPHKSRKGIYRIADPFVGFWYRFVYPNLDRLELGDAGVVLDSVVKPALPHFISQAIEPYLPSLFGPRGIASLGAQVPFQPCYLGRHWSRKTELDLLLLSEDRRRGFVGELKWQGRAISPEAMADLRSRVAREETLRGVELTFALISRSGFTKTSTRPLPDERYIDLGAMAL
ncbi:MAG: ATP-binding protein [Polyangia bacterium]|jgi:AAA+ ATPase superfamily predicted ATPase|nr:ATP-binding protein [Polyangia bacterium]